MKSQNCESLWADLPIKSCKEDSFDRLKIAESTARLLNSSSSGESSVVAYIGPWGCGKTSLINMTIGELKKEENKWKVVHFSPWATSDIEGMMNEFHVTLRSALPKDQDEELKKRLAQIMQIAAPTVKIIPGIGDSLQEAGKLAIEKMTEREPWNKLFGRVDVELKKLPYKILVVADDIDRLQEDELRIFFKLIRLIGNLSNVFYLVAYDNDAITGILSGNFSKRYNENQIGKYIEKFIQFPIYVPQVSEYMSGDLLINEIKKCIPKYFDNIDWVFYSNLVIFVNFLNTPRSLARFINQFKIHASHYSGDDVSYSELLVITLIKLHFSGLHQEIYKNRGTLTRVGIPLGFLGTDSSSEGMESFDNFVERVESDNNIKKNNIKLLVSSLFPNYGAYLGKLENEGGKLTRTLTGFNFPRDQYKSEVSISNEWSFHRYFDFGMDNYDISESSLIDAIKKANNGEFIHIYLLINGVDIRLNELLFPKLENIIKDLIIQKNIEIDVLSFVIILMLRRMQRLDKFALDNVNRRWVADRILGIIWDFIENMDTNSYSYKDVENILGLQYEIHFQTQFRLVYHIYRDVDAKFNSIKSDIEEIWHRYCDMAADKLEKHLCEGDNADYSFPFLGFLTCVMESNSHKRILREKFKSLYIEKKISPDDYISRFVEVMGTRNMVEFEYDLYRQFTTFDLDDPQLGYDDYFDSVDNFAYGALATWKVRAIYAKRFLMQKRDQVLGK